MATHPNPLRSAASPGAFVETWWRRGRTWAPLLVVVFGALAALGANASLPSVLSALANLLVCGFLLWTVRDEARAIPKSWKISAILFLLAILIPLVRLGLGAPPAAAQPLAALALAQGGSVAPDQTLVEIAKLLGLAGLVVAVAFAAANIQRAVTVLQVLQAGAVVYTLAALTLYQADPTLILGSEKTGHWERFTGTLLNANAAGAVFGLFAILGAGLLRRQLSLLSDLHPMMRRSRYAELAIQILVILLFVGACALTRSRISLGGLAIALAFLSLGAIPRRFFRNVRVGRRIDLAAMTVAVALIGLLGGSAFMRGDFAQNLQGRVDGLVHILRLTLEAPWGFGLGSFRVAFVHELPAASAPVLWNYGAAHNSVLQAALEGGWLFAALLLSSIGVLILPALKATAPRGGRSVKLSLAVSLLLLGAISLTDIVLNVPAAATLGACLLGLFAATNTWAETSAPAAVGSVS
ncbi:O-antigen ligase family protein [Phenylobacterium sp. LjRoot225]|uniref:O-antigen ligase family protein n=1 Tax=Phenylobacterium sp. LjRoot225 TaxID=3342285 RepID=UPI003ECD43CA